jgi:nucleotide-binding universal stress UspA family protein
MAFHNPKPASAALEVIRDTDVGLVVFGADRRRLGRWSFKRIARRIRRDATCLVWTNEP